jgi:outer membrane lipoprotein SlyB
LVWEFQPTTHLALPIITFNSAILVSITDTYLQQYRSELMSKNKHIQNAIEVDRNGDKTLMKIKPSTKDAFKGAATGAVIGGRFGGPYGAAIGAGIGGTIGFVFGDPD